uniref:Uncharacterized protein n=1 Tax=Setaria viridis TaxID=4556 RepID=A0A4U6V9I3_SETVI|nr:hypothetical protein SEVIR_3G150700v2 [Setaria viridis]
MGLARLAGAWLTGPAEAAQATKRALVEHGPRPNALALPKGAGHPKGLQLRRRSPANPALRSHFGEAEPKKKKGSRSSTSSFPTLALGGGPVGKRTRLRAGSGRRRRASGGRRQRRGRRRAGGGRWRRREADNGDGREAGAETTRGPGAGRWGRMDREGGRRMGGWRWEVEGRK